MQLQSKFHKIGFTVRFDSMPFAPLLELCNVSWRVGAKTILRDVSLVITSGEFVSIMGPSGSGKSSLLKLIVRLIDMTDGAILLEGQNILEMDVIHLRRQIGLILQDSHMFDGTVRDNLAYGPLLQNKPVNEAKMLRLLPFVHLQSDILDQNAAELSGGERQRVAIVRMLMNEPKILLLDEITSALDLGTTLLVEDLIKSLQASTGITIIMISHDFEQAKRMDGTCVFLADGTVVESGPSVNIFNKPQNALTAKFLQGELS